MPIDFMKSAFSLFECTKYRASVSEIQKLANNTIMFKERCMTKLKRNIKAALPDLSSKEIDDVLLYMKQKRLEDPLALLQPTISRKGEEQMLITHLTPSFELGFFLAQLTGSFMYTDNKKLQILNHYLYLY